MNKQLRDSIKRLMLEGKGRRVIAKELGVSERKVRRVCKDLVSIGEADYAPSGRKKANNPSGIPLSPFTVDIEVEVEETVPIDSTLPAIKQGHSRGERVIVLSDIHIPYEDKDAVEIAISYMKDNTPDHIVLNGDIADFYTVSSYDKYTRNRPTLQDEIEAVISFLRRLRDLFPDAKISFLEGNHETRLRKYIQKNADAFTELDALTLPKLFKVEEVQVDYYGPSEPLEIGKLLITHGELCRKAAGSTARGHRDKYNSSILVGHIHRGSVAFQRVKDGQHIMIENPCLCDMKVEYGTFFDWLHGFTEILAYPDGEIVAHTHPIINKKLHTMEGKIYEPQS